MIRPATIADVARIEAIVADAYSPYIARIGRPPGPMLDDYDARVREGCAWVAELDGGVVGVIVLLARDDHVLLDNVAVAPAVRGRGVGKALMAFAEAEAVRRGVGEMRLYTHELMLENIAMYSALGWREIGRGEQAGFRRVFFGKTLACSKMSH